MYCHPKNCPRSLRPIANVPLDTQVGGKAFGNYNSILHINTKYFCIVLTYTEFSTYTTTRYMVLSATYQESLTSLENPVTDNSAALDLEFPQQYFQQSTFTAVTSG